jgi:hypothetical protein
MKEAKEGPWKADKCGLHFYAYREATPNPCCRFMSYPFDSQKEAQSHANELNAAERLKDAAPKLLAALKVAAPWLKYATFDCQGKSQAEFDAMMDQVEEAIAEAKGEA